MNETLAMKMQGTKKTDESMNELLEKVAENAEIEFNEFKDDELEKSKEEIFEDNYKIRFFDEMHEFLISENLLQSYELSVIAKHGTAFISHLYDFYLGSEYAAITNWEEVVDMIADFCDRR